MLIDSNSIIYAAQAINGELRKFVEAEVPFVSAISYVEALGYHQLQNDERQYLETFFSSAKILALSQPILTDAVLLRQQRKLSLGDALIAGTARVHKLTLVTRNDSDFRWIPNLTLLNPFI